ncbi:MAG: efflux RND transporter periplasmic adaptor subunit [Candidatus Delongbacteria bacterium]|nr:efflux RND transporter periplasmic adaptor subunit [Candidatus Delongbacteria bacterium]
MMRFVMTGVLLMGLAGWQCGKTERSLSEHTVRVQRREFQSSLVEAGEIKALQSLSINVPMVRGRFGGDIKVIRIIEDGREVKPGDTLVVLDPSSIEKDIDTRQSSIEMTQAEYRKALAKHQASMDELESNLKNTEINQQLKQLELDGAQYEAEVRKKEIQLDLGKVKLDLEKVKTEIQNQKNLNQQEQQRLLNDIKNNERWLKESQEDLKNMTIRAAVPGIALINKNPISDIKFAPGSQVWPGFSLINLPDLSKLLVEMEISEADISKISLGQSVMIRLDAYSDTVFTGKIHTIAGLARLKNGSSRIKVFPVDVLVDGRHRNLMPGMTVSCEIMVATIPDTLFLPIEAIFKENDQSFVWLKDGRSFRQQFVSTGRMNRTDILIESGLEENDEVSLINPEINDDKKQP